MADQHARGESSGGSEAEATFSEFLERRASGEELEFEEFTAGLQLTDEVRRALLSLWNDYQASAHSAAASDSAASELLEQLSAHSPKAGRYSLRGEIARGGMGAVLRVWDADLRRDLAMKVVLGKAPPQESGATPAVDERTLGRFLEEAQVTGQLDHPGVVPVHELGVDDRGRVYFTMRLVKGRNLRAILEDVREGRDGWNPTRALGVLLKACEALAYAHSKGVIHRDLKPANIMVGRFGEVYVMDWGLARALGRPDRKDIRLRLPGATSLASIKTLRRDAAEETPDSPLVTMDGDVVGTPAFMSPEQARGEVQSVGRRSDVYSMGAILYELLSGRMPYVQPGAKVSARTILAAVLEGPPRPIRQSKPGVPAELEAICEKAMARDPTARYADMIELAEDLRAYVEGRVVRAHRTGAVIELRKWVQRNKALATAAGAAVLLLVAGVALMARLTWVEIRAREEQEILGRFLGGALERESQAHGKTEEALREARWQTYVANIRAAAVNLETGFLSECRRRLDACPQEARGWEWGHLDLETDHAVLVLRGHERSLYQAVFSPDGSRFASAFVDGTIRLWDATSGVELARLQGADLSQGPGARGYSLAFSPDGSRIAGACRDRVVRLWSVESGAVTLEHDGRCSSIAFSPDGQRLALADSIDGAVRVLDANLGTELLVLRGHEGPIHSVAFSPDGSLLASGGIDATVRLWDALSGATVDVLRAEAGVLDATFSPDGAMLASCGGDAAVTLWDVASRQVLRVMRGHVGVVLSVGFSPGGDRLASGGADRSVRIWDARDGTELSVLRGHEDWIASVCFDRDGARLASCSRDGTLRVWDADAPASPSILRAASGWVHAVACSPDGSRVAAGVAIGAIQIWDASNGLEFSLWQVGEWAVRCLAYSPDGAALASGAEDGSVVLWDSTTGDALAVLRQPRSKVTSISFCADGSRLACGIVDGSIDVLDRSGGREPLVLKGHEGPVLSVAFSPDGQRIASGSLDRTVRVWDASSGVGLFRGEHQDGVPSVAFAPGGELVASAGGEDATIRLWSVLDGASVAVLRGHQGNVSGVAFSPDGSRLASAGNRDGTVRVWDVHSGSELAVLHTLQLPESVWFSPDGRRLVVMTTSAQIQIFDSDPDAARAMWAGTELRRRAQHAVDGLYDEHLRKDAVLARLDGDPNLESGMHELVRKLAELRGDLLPNELNTRAWRVVMSRPSARAGDRDPTPVARRELEAALRMAEAACGQSPDVAAFLNTLGAVQLRLGRFEEAIATLEKADELNRGSNSPYNRASDLFFLAMARQQLGQLDRARQDLLQARELSLGSTDVELLGLLREAESVVAGTVATDPAPAPATDRR